MEKIIHPTHSDIELHFLPHQRLFDKKNGCYLIPSKGEKVSIPVQTTKKVNLDKVILECKLKRKLQSNEDVKLIDGNRFNKTIENLDVVSLPVIKNSSRRIIAKYSRNGESLAKTYDNISALTKELGIAKSLVVACCDVNINNVKSQNETWYTFSWGELDVDKVTVELRKIDIN